jgi:hypothetical protein
MATAESFSQFMGVTLLVLDTPPRPCIVTSAGARSVQSSGSWGSSPLPRSRNRRAFEGPSRIYLDRSAERLEKETRAPKHA